MSASAFATFEAREPFDPLTITISPSRTAPVTIGLIAETDPGVFALDVTPTAPGTLQFAVLAGASITDVAGNALETA